jgi:hypothetical protein
MADELGIKHQTVQTDCGSRIKFTGEYCHCNIHIDENGNDMSSWDETSSDIQHLYEDLYELISCKREREKLTPEQLKLIKKRNGDKTRLQGLRDGYLCWINKNLVWNTKNKLYVNRKEDPEEFTFKMNEIDELLDLVYSWT